MPAPRLTSNKYFRTVETVLPQELIHGIVREAPAPTPGHQSVVGQFFMALVEDFRQHDAGGIWLAPIDVVLDRQRRSLSSRTSSLLPVIACISSPTACGVPRIS